MGCAASASTKLTSVMPIDEETVNDDDKSQNVVPFQVSASCLKYFGFQWDLDP